MGERIEIEYLTVTKRYGYVSPFMGERIEIIAARIVEPLPASRLSWASGLKSDL